MNFTYIQFEAPNEDFSPPVQNKSAGWLEDFCVKYLPLFVSRANPEFDPVVNDVVHWMLELNETGVPEREIGLGANGEPILVMPWNNNYGYWTDNNLKLHDFQAAFEVTEINHQTFVDAWYKFGAIGCNDCFRSEISEFVDQRTWLEFDLELTKRLGRNHMMAAKFIHDGIPDKDGGLNIYVCQSCQTKWKLREPNDRGGGYFRRLK